MTALHDTGELTCPRCGAVLDDVDEHAPEEELVGKGDDELLRAPFDCPDCGAPLELVVESALPEALGVDVYVEDRRAPEE